MFVKDVYPSHYISSDEERCKYDPEQARPEDIVNLDLKSTLRVLYNLFTKYKHLS